MNEMILPYLPERKGLQKTVIDAMDDAVEAGGKRIRPRLIYETYVMFCRKYGRDIRNEAVAPFMAGMEMMHSASLIHDDLPCMDNDQLRRGKPTTWVTYGEDMATLAGDALMIESLAVMARAAAAEKGAEEKARAIEALNLFGYKAGYQGMTGGQTVDVENTGKPLSREQLDFIYRLKTGALLEASMMMGAILAGASAEEVSACEKIAANVGMSFQIRDDILDETATEEELGKPILSDAENDKTTFVSIYGLKAADEEVKKLSREAIELLRSLNCESGELEKIIVSLIDRKN